MQPSQSQSLHSPKMKRARVVSMDGIIVRSYDSLNEDLLIMDIAVCITAFWAQKDHLFAICS